MTPNWDLGGARSPFSTLRAGCENVGPDMRFRTAPWTLGLAVMGKLGVTAFLSGIWLQLFWLRLANKAVPLFCCIMWLRHPRERYTRWMVAGWALSLIGVLVLEAREDLFLVCLDAFLLAHVAYIAAYVSALRTPHCSLGAPFLHHRPARPGSTASAAACEGMKTHRTAPDFLTST